LAFSEASSKLKIQRKDQDNNMLHGTGAITHCYIDSICMYICGLARWQLENTWRHVATHFFFNLYFSLHQYKHSVTKIPVSSHLIYVIKNIMTQTWMLVMNHVLLLLGIKYFQKALFSSNLNLCSPSKYETKVQSHIKMAKWFLYIWLILQCPATGWWQFLMCLITHISRIYFCYNSIINFLSTCYCCYRYYFLVFQWPGWYLNFSALCVKNVLFKLLKTTLWNKEHFGEIKTQVSNKFPWCLNIKNWIFRAIFLHAFAYVNARQVKVSVTKYTFPPLFLRIITVTNLPSLPSDPYLCK